MQHTASCVDAQNSIPHTDTDLIHSDNLFIWKKKKKQKGPKATNTAVEYKHENKIIVARLKCHN